MNRTLLSLLLTEIVVLVAVSPGHAQDAPATLVVIAHHDAPQTGLVFDQTLLKAAWDGASSRHAEGG